MKPPKNDWTRRERRRFKKPFDLLPYCQLPTGGRWADLGCGRGYFSGALAHLLGPDGRVLAVDLDRRPLLHMQRSLAPTDWHGRIWPIQTDLRQPLPFEELEGLVAANVFHFFQDDEKKSIIKRLRHAVQPGGQLVIVEYNHNRPTGAVPHPLSADGWLDLLADSGWNEPWICARTPSSYLGEMVALSAYRPS